MRDLAVGQIRSQLFARLTEDFAVVFVHCGSVSVVDATYLGFVFNAV